MKRMKRPQWMDEYELDQLISQVWDGVSDFNRKVEKAEADGYTVAEGFVWEAWGDFAAGDPYPRRLCPIADYPA